MTKLVIIAKILAMNNLFAQQTPDDIAMNLAKRVRMRRKEHKLTQADAAERSGVSLASYKRFEQTGEISLKSLIRISIALGCEENFEELFAQKFYASIEDVINERG